MRKRAPEVQDVVYMTESFTLTPDEDHEKITSEGLTVDSTYFEPNGTILVLAFNKRGFGRNWVIGRSYNPDYGNALTTIRNLSKRAAMDLVKGLELRSKN